MVRPKTPTEIAKENSDRLAKELKDEILTKRPPLHEPSNFRKSINDKFTENLSQATQEVKDKLDKIKRSSAEVFHDWVASMMEIFGLAQSMNMKLSMLLWHKKIPIVDLVAHGVNTLGDKIANKKVDVKVSVDVDAHGLVSVIPTIPQDMQDQNGRNPVFTNFANQTAKVYEAIINQDDLVYNEQPVKATYNQNTNKLQLEYGLPNELQLMAENDVNNFLRANAQHLSNRMQEIYNKHVELEVDAPRPPF